MAFSFTRAGVPRQGARGRLDRARERARRGSLLAAAPAGDRDPAHGHVARLSGARHHPRPMGDLLTIRSTRICRRRFFAGPRSCRRRRALPGRTSGTGRILDSLPADVRAATDADVARVQAEARDLVRTEALSRAAGVQLGGTARVGFRARRPRRGPRVRRGRRGAGGRRRERLGGGPVGVRRPRRRRAAARWSWTARTGAPSRYSQCATIAMPATWPKRRRS